MQSFGTFDILRQVVYGVGEYFHKNGHVIEGQGQGQKQFFVNNF